MRGTCRPDAAVLPLSRENSKSLQSGSWDTNQATVRDDRVSRRPLPLGTRLEIGSGTGLFTPALATAFAEVISVDLSEQMLRHAAGRSPPATRRRQRLPSADASVTVVVAIDHASVP